MQNRAYGPNTPTVSATSNTKCPDLGPLYISRTGIKMCSGAYASLSQDTDYTGVGVGRSSRGGPVFEVRPS